MLALYLPNYHPLDNLDPTLPEATANETETITRLITVACRQLPFELPKGRIRPQGYKYPWEWDVCFCSLSRWHLFSAVAATTPWNNNKSSNNRRSNKANFKEPYYSYLTF